MHPIRRYRHRVDLQVALFSTLLIALLSLALAFFFSILANRMSLQALETRSQSIYHFVTSQLLLSRDAQLDGETSSLLQEAETAFGLRRLYLARQAEGRWILYPVQDGVIEGELLPYLEQALSGKQSPPRQVTLHGQSPYIFTCYPIWGDREALGVLCLEFESGSAPRISSSLWRGTLLISLLASLLAALCAFTFFRRISNPLFQDFSNTDQLTQLKNRNSFELDLDHLGVRRAEAGTGILLVDLNNLKSVNDQLGHEAGDHYLRLVSSALRSVQNGWITAYRVGGDEFVLLCRDSGLQKLNQLMHVISTRFQQIRPPWPIDLSLSIGHALYNPLEDETLRATFRRADSMMYQCKRLYHQRFC